MKRVNLVVLLLVLAGLVCPFGNAQAATLVSNLAEAQAGWDGVMYGQWASASFTTGPNGPYMLNSATIQSNGSTTANFQVAVYSDTGGTPGAHLQTLTGTAVHGAGQETFTSPGLFFASNTTYWLVALENPDTTGAGTFRETVSNSQTSSDGWTIGDAGYLSLNQGVSWVPSLGQSMFSIDATPAAPMTYQSPTLNTWGMIIFTLLAAGMAVFYLRRKAQA